MCVRCVKVHAEGSVTPESESIRGSEDDGCPVISVFLLLLKLKTCLFLGEVKPKAANIQMD